jgi:hypothetical protein
MQYHQQGIAAPQLQHAQNPPPYQNQQQGFNQQQQGFNQQQQGFNQQQQGFNQQQQQQPSPGWMDASASQHASGMMYPANVETAGAPGAPPPNNQYQQQQTPSLAPPPNFNTGADMSSHSIQGLSQYNGSAYGAYGAQQPHAKTSESKNWGVDAPSGWGVARTHWEQQPADFTQPSAPLPPVTVAECPFCFKDTEHLSPPLDCGTTICVLVLLYIYVSARP